MVEQVINPAAISGLLDPWIKEREQQQLGAGMGQAFQALQSEDYPAMAKALQGIAGQNPQVGIALMTAAHQQQQLRQAEKLKQTELAQQERLRREEMGKPAFTDMGMHTYDSGTGKVTMRPWSQDAGGNWVLGPPQIIDPNAVAGGPLAAAPATAAAPPPPTVAAPEAAVPAAGGGKQPGQTDIDTLRQMPHKADRFDQEFGTPDNPHPSQAILGQQGAGATGAAAAPAPAAPAAPSPAGPGALAPPMGVSPGEWRKGLATQAAKQTMANIQARENAVKTLPRIQRAIDDWDRLAQLGGIGPYVGSSVGQAAYRYGPLNTEIGNLQARLQQELMALQLQSNVFKGQGAVSNFERTLVQSSLPNLSMKDPAAGRQVMGDLLAALQRDIQAGRQPVQGR
jgi:hypothetical protein